MTAEEFVQSATNRMLLSRKHRSDSKAFREWLVDRYEEIHAAVRCEHARGEAYVLAKAILELAVDGPVIECGCYQGGMTCKLSIVCKFVGRELYVCDSFQGLPAPDTNYRHYDQRKDVVDAFGLDCRFEEGQYCGTRDVVERHVAEHGELDVCTFVEGFFDQTLHTIEVEPALVMLDVDLVSSARDCLRWWWPRLMGPAVFTHEAFVETYMRGLLDEEWWWSEFGCRPPIVEGDVTGLGKTASCLARLSKACVPTKDTHVNV